MASNYITLAALKATLNITGTAQDADLNASISSSSRAVEKMTRRKFWVDASDVTRYYTPTKTRWLEIDDLVSLTSLKTDDDGTFTYPNTWTLNTDFLLEPLNAAVEDPVRPWESILVHPTGSFTFNTLIPRSAQVIGKFGWPAIPDEVVDAVTHLAAKVFKIKREAPLGAVVLDQVAIRAARRDPLVCELVGPLTRHRYSVG